MSIDVRCLTGAFVAGVFLIGTAWAAPGVSGATDVSPDETDARKIMAAVEGRARGDRAKGRLQMTITDGAGRQRVRVVQMRSMQFDAGTRQLMIFESPADVRNTGLLSVDYDDGNKDDDQWLYMPSLAKATRISSGDKTGSFLGTDFTYSDMTKPDPAHYDYEMVTQSEKVGDEDCWVIQSTPKTQKAKDETGYLKSQVWVSKAKMMPLQAKNWVVKGRKLKYIKFDDVRQVDGIWVAHKLSARTLRGKQVESTTVLQFQELSFNNADVSDALFSERQFEKGL